MQKLKIHEIFMFVFHQMQGHQNDIFVLFLINSAKLNFKKQDKSLA